MTLQKYSALFHDGPEVVHTCEAPEVVPHESFRHGQHAENYPEIDRRHSTSAKETINVYEDPESVASSYQTHEVKSITPDVQRDDWDGMQRKHQGRRYCGMRKAVFIAVVVLLSLIIVGVAVGVGAGISLSGKKNSSSSQALQAISMTGLATVSSGDTMYQYFQAPNGSILENSYSNGQWSLQGTAGINALVTTKAGPASPLAAIVYPFAGQTYRQIFYLNDVGQVATTNRTQDGTWSTPTTITGEVVTPNSIALAACWNDNDLYGFRVYYASQVGGIQELGGYFNGSQWIGHSIFPGADLSSGVACATDGQNLNLYFRNKQTGTVVQQNYNYAVDNYTYWNDGPLTAYTAIVGSDIAACTDPSGAQYVFFQSQDNEIMLGTLNAQNTAYETFTQRQTSITGSKLAAAYVNGGALVAFQGDPDSSTMWISDVSRTGGTILNTTIA